MFVNCELNWIFCPVNRSSAGWVPSGPRFRRMAAQKGRYLQSQRHTQPFICRLRSSSQRPHPTGHGESIPNHQNTLPLAQIATPALPPLRRPELRIPTSHRILYQVRNSCETWHRNRSLDSISDQRGLHFPASQHPAYFGRSRFFFFVGLVGPWQLTAKAYSGP